MKQVYERVSVEFLNPCHICVITCMCSESKQGPVTIIKQGLSPQNNHCFFPGRCFSVILLHLTVVYRHEYHTHLSCWESCCFRSLTAWWTRRCKWTLWDEQNIKVSSECTRPCLHYSQMIISSIVWYIKALRLGLHSGAFTEKRPAGGIIRWDFPQLGMTGLWADSRVWLIISWAGSLNTD